MDEALFRERGILFLTNKCNNNCVICQDREPWELMKEWPKIKEDLDHLISSGIRELTIYGGEPFINKSMPKVLDYLSPLDLEVSLSSNARVFSQRRFVEEIKKLKKVHVQTTLFSHDADVHDYITSAKGSHAQAVQGIRNLLAERIDVGVTVVLTAANTKDLTETVQFLASLGVRRIKISGLIDKGALKERPDMKVSFERAMKEIKRLYDWNGVKDMSLVFEKLPLCILPGDVKGSFVHEPQHKKDMTACPADKASCDACARKQECMCS